MPEYTANIGLTYPIDPVVHDALVAFGVQSAAAYELAAKTHDPRDIDAANTAALARDAAIETAMSSGAMRRVEAGETAFGLHPASVPWLLEQGHIRVAVPTEDDWSNLGRPAEPQEKGGS